MHRSAPVSPKCATTSASSADPHCRGLLRSLRADRPTRACTRRRSRCRRRSGLSSTAMRARICASSNPVARIRRGSAARCRIAGAGAEHDDAFISGSRPLIQPERAGPPARRRSALDIVVATAGPCGNVPVSARFPCGSLPTAAPPGELTDDRADEFVDHRVVLRAAQLHGGARDTTDRRAASDCPCRHRGSPATSPQDECRPRRYTARACRSRCRYRRA